LHPDRGDQHDDSLSTRRKRLQIINRPDVYKDQSRDHGAKNGERNRTNGWQN
jgi:hypothetical protein